MSEQSVRVRLCGHSWSLAHPLPGCRTLSYNAPGEEADPRRKPPPEPTAAQHSFRKSESNIRKKVLFLKRGIASSLVCRTASRGS